MHKAIQTIIISCNKSENFRLYSPTNSLINKQHIPDMQLEPLGHGCCLLHVSPIKSVYPAGQVSGGAVKGGSVTGT